MPRHSLSHSFRYAVPLITAARLRHHREIRVTAIGNSLSYVGTHDDTTVRRRTIVLPVFSVNKKPTALGVPHVVVSIWNEGKRQQTGVSAVDRRQDGVVTLRQRAHIGLVLPMSESGDYLRLDVPLWRKKASGALLRRLGRYRPHRRRNRDRTCKYHLSGLRSGTRNQNRWRIASRPSLSRQ